MIKAIGKALLAAALLSASGSSAQVTYLNCDLPAYWAGWECTIKERGLGMRILLVSPAGFSGRVWASAAKLTGGEGKEIGCSHHHLFRPLSTTQPGQ